MEHLRRRSVTETFRSLRTEIGPELFVAGVLSILLCLVSTRVFLPPPVLPVIGLVAFLAFLICSAALLSLRHDVRWLDIPAWGVAGFLAIVWIAAGQLIDVQHVERWLPQ